MRAGTLQAFKILTKISIGTLPLLICVLSASLGDRGERGGKLKRQEIFLVLFFVPACRQVGAPVLLECGAGGILD